jgi:zinc transport system substrate-binding protein
MKNKKLILLISTFLILGIGTIYSIVKRADSLTLSEKIQITTSFYPYYFLATEIGGDKVNVVNITPAGAEPHEYEPSSGDMVQIRSSNILILNGIIEPWQSKIEDDLKNKSTIIVVAGDGLFTKKSTNNEDVSSVDPHVWLSPVLVKKQVEKISQTFIETDPTNKSYYAANANKLSNKLSKLDENFKTGLKSCQRKDIVTSHAAFGYLASTYELTQTSIAGLSPEEEPSLKQLANIANFVKTNGIKYIFFESLVSPKLSETIARETGASTLVLNPLEGLTPEEFKEGKNYLTIMEDNLHNLEMALDCK